MADEKRTLVLIMIFCMISSVSSFGEVKNISVIANGTNLEFDVNPIINNGYTLVPFRYIFEFFGADDITWQQNLQKATGVFDGKTIEFIVDSDFAKVNGQSVKLDSPPKLVNGRVLIPLRFISETLDFDVSWDNDTRTVYINSIEKTYVYNKNLDISINLNDDVNSLIKLMGQADRIDKSGMYYEWYVYNKNLENFIQVGVSEGKIVAFATNAESWSINKQFRIGDLKEDIVSAYEKLIEHRDGYTNRLNNDDSRIIFMWDIHTNYSLSGFIIDAFVRGVPGYLRTSYDDEVCNDFARQAFDITNVYRLRNKKSVLKWSDELSEMALYHSSDMASKSYFNHTSPSGVTMAHRAKMFLSNYRGVGENISLGYENAFTSMAGLYNSLGHRVNILDKDWRYLGIGLDYDINRLYLTQNFMY